MSLDLAIEYSIPKKISKWFSQTTGQPLTFAIAMLMVIAWGLTGLIWGFGLEHQMAINTITTIITFLMIFLLQGSQNTDTEEMQKKLDRILEEMHK